LPFRRNPIQDTAERAYGTVVGAARRPEFFTALGVPDSLDGRFELICLHAFLYLRKLKGLEPPTGELGQRFVDHMFADFDRSLREIGVGDLSVGRQINRMAEAFYGRVRAYEDGLAAGDETLSEALARNLYGTVSATPEQLSRMTAYVRRETTAPSPQPFASLPAGDVVFSAP
jgi:cytochrome b pre-mRNA-processing protein 3